MTVHRMGTVFFVGKTDFKGEAMTLTIDAELLDTVVSDLVSEGVDSDEAKEIALWEFYGSADD